MHVNMSEEDTFYSHPPPLFPPLHAVLGGTEVLKAGKAFDITYVRLFFRSPRPESFAIFKRTEEVGEWIPYQYYSATCRDTYGIPDSNYVQKEYETRALCTSEFSDISPLTGGNVAFSTLEGRPSAYAFEESLDLQEWVTATDIRIILDRLNTFRDEVFGDPKVLRSYFYAITDLAVGGRLSMPNSDPLLSSHEVNRRPAKTFIVSYYLSYGSARNAFLVSRKIQSVQPCHSFKMKVSLQEIRSKCQCRSVFQEFIFSHL
ncbi:Laminin subunit gamma-1 [Halocaridina rubra]|uniref:Laminin subunit gamma-1 n=1 Tax=Halocaridina rubra TaxID=373956 RepID=A0AAN8XD47_HALRR